MIINNKASGDIIAPKSMKQVQIDPMRKTALVVAGKLLVAIHNWTFLVGPGLIPGVNALLLGYLMYRSALVPRIIPVLGLIGGPLLLASATATLLGIYPQISVWSGIATVPVALWELALGVWLAVKGFKPCPITAAMLAAGTPPAARDGAA
jgi:hypothetical protein